jgi:hypothetical protein
VLEQLLGMESTSNWTLALPMISDDGSNVDGPSTATTDVSQLPDSLLYPPADQDKGYECFNFAQDMGERIQSNAFVDPSDAQWSARYFALNS